MTKKADPKSFIKDTLAQYGQSGFFTHAYFECGRLAEKTPFFQTSWGNDQRTVFDLASLTKALVTAPLVFWCAEKKRLNVKASLGEWLSGFSSPLPSWILSLSIEELLQHKSGLPAWHNFYVNRLSEDARPEQMRANSHAWIESVFSREEIRPLEKKDRYSDLGFILLGYALEKISGADLRTLFGVFLNETSIARESSLGFFADFSHRDLVPSAYCEIRRRVLAGEIHDENAAALGGFAGHAGLFSSGAALGIFLKSFSQSSFGKSFLRVNKDAAIEKSDSSLFGWRQGNEEGFSFAAKKAIGHYGFVGTSFWINPADDSYVIFLSNRVISGRVSSQIKPLRFSMFTAAEEICAARVS